jgi:hypothetical protein
MRKRLHAAPSTVEHHSPPGDRRRTASAARCQRRRRRAVSRRRILSCAVVLACTLPASLALGASPAGAYVRINEHCILRVIAPMGAGAGKFVFGGNVDCTAYGNVWTSLEVCAEVQNTGSGQWFLINNSCAADGPTYRSLNELASVHEGALCGVNYRTWDYGVAWHGGGGGPTTEWGHAEYRSSPVQIC